MEEYAHIIAGAILAAGQKIADSIDSLVDVIAADMVGGVEIESDETKMCEECGEKGSCGKFGSRWLCPTHLLEALNNDEEA